jgi:drug/metabolite transporter (DMT)-like permease
MSWPAVLLLVANVVYGTSYVVTRLTLDDVPPATLALARLVLGGAILLALTRREGVAAFSKIDRRAIAWMGVLGFAGAFALGNWGLERSTATDAAFLIVVEPVALILLGPLLLGERLPRGEMLGAAIALAGTLVLVVNGVPGLTYALIPHWRGDILLILSGLAYASYTLLGRRILTRHSALAVTARSIVWGAAAMAPVALAEWLHGARPLWTPKAVAGTLYLAVVVTALGYLAWNHALSRMQATRAAVFLTVQPVIGALLGVVVLGERLTPFALTGAGLILGGLWIALGSARAGPSPPG